MPVTLVAVVLSTLFIDAVAKIGKMSLDANGVPCGSFLADKQSCALLRATPHVRHYAFCEVQRDTIHTCPEPIAQAMDAKGNPLQVTKRVTLFVKSSPQVRTHVNENVLA